MVQIVGRHELPGERLRLQRERLRGPRLLAYERRRGNRLLDDGEERFARRPVEQEDVSRLRDLRGGIDSAPLVHDGHQVGWGRRIAIPQIMVYEMKMPDPLTRFGIERKERIAEQVHAHAIASVEVGCRWPRRDVHEAPLRIETPAGPGIRPTHIRPGVIGPCLIAVLARLRNRMEYPFQVARSYVEGTNVARRRIRELRDP